MAAVSKQMVKKDKNSAKILAVVTKDVKLPHVLFNNQGQICCRVCKSGVACGDRCLAPKAVCPSNTLKGCACNAANMKVGGSKIVLPAQNPTKSRLHLSTDPFTKAANDGVAASVAGAAVSVKHVLESNNPFSQGASASLVKAAPEAFDAPKAPSVPKAFSSASDKVSQMLDQAFTGGKKAPAQAPGAATFGAMEAGSKTNPFA